MNGLIVSVLIFLGIGAVLVLAMNVRCPVCRRRLPIPFGMWGTAQVGCRSCGTRCVVATGILRRRVVDWTGGQGGMPVEPASGAIDGRDGAEPTRDEAASEDRSEPVPVGAESVASIEKLAALHEAGKLTDDEFAEAKRRILDAI